MASFLKGNANLAVVRIIGKNIPTLSQFVEVFNDNVLMDPSKVDTLEVTGWTNSKDVLRRHFDYDDAVGQWFHANYCKCVKKIPSALMKVHQTSAFEEYKKSTGKYPRREDKAKILNDLEKKLMPFAVPTFRTIPIIVDTSTGYVFVGTNKYDKLEEVVLQLRRTFEASPIEIELSQALDVIFEKAGIDYKSVEQGNHSFPAKDKPKDLYDATPGELMTWLYFMWEKNGFVNDTDILFEEGMTLHNLSEVGPEKVSLTRGVAPLEGPMLWETFAKGYLLRECNLHIVPKDAAVQRDFAFGVNESMFLVRVKPPKKVDLDERFNFFEELFETWQNKIVTEFARIRSDKKLWSGVLKEFHFYVEAKIANGGTRSRS